MLVILSDYRDRSPIRRDRNVRLSGFASEEVGSPRLFLGRGNVVVVVRQARFLLRLMKTVRYMPGVDSSSPELPLVHVNSRS